MRELSPVAEQSLQKVYDILRMSREPLRFAWLHMNFRERRQWLIDAGIGGTIWLVSRTWHELTGCQRRKLIETADRVGEV